MSSLFIICSLLCVVFYCMPAKRLYALSNFVELKLARVENKEIIIDGVNIKYYQGGRGKLRFCCCMVLALVKKIGISFRRL